LLVVQLILAAYLHLRGGGFGAVLPDQPLVEFDVAAVDRLVITDGTGAGVELVKQDGGWRLPGHFDFPASGPKVEALVKDLQGLRTRLPVATTPDAFARFKVAPEQFERRIAFNQGDKELALLYLGDSPGFKRLFARDAKAESLFEVAYSAHQAGAKASDWTDKGLLAISPDQITGLDLNGLRLTKEPQGDQESWRIEGESAEVDQAKAGELARAAANLSFLEVLGTEAKPEYGLDVPAVRLTLKFKEGEPREVLIAKLGEGKDYVLKAAHQPWYFKVGDWTVQGLKDASRETLVKPAPQAESPPAEPASAAPATPAGPVDAIPATPAGPGDAIPATPAAPGDATPATPAAPVDATPAPPS